MDLLLLRRIAHTFLNYQYGKERKTLKLELKLGKESKRIGKKYGHICVGFFITPVPTCPRSATVTSTKNDLQTQKEVGTSEHRALTFGLSPVIKLGICHPEKKENTKKEHC